MVDRNDVNLGGRLSEWQCHKRVRAAKILRVGRPADWIEGGAPTIGADTLRLDVPSETFDVWIEPKPGMFARYRPVPGDYYVIYDYDTPDEYHSISQAAAFEKGYAQLVGTVG